MSNRMAIVLCPIVTIVVMASATVVNQGKPIFCSRANISEVRIQGCKREPCTLKKGTKLPFEIDFSFTAPETIDYVDLNAFAPYWNVPGHGVYGTNLATSDGIKCEDFSEGRKGENRMALHTQQ
ncbi:uncharacterized protein LOC110844871 isoform X2 [Folsomia candida]|uniref:uncharacterized protein LOC110844871 isoform X2 n=1 Tax=Folsomia candida TaxID=158441 RepID=UPI0016054B0C|nr:uncharacterized protein LOC110844871 isoform X2 [Folsomia candida]